MKIDIVRPALDTETSFINMARRLGYNGICFLYDEKSNPFSRIKLIKSKIEKFQIYSAVISKKPKTSEFDFVFSDNNSQRNIKSGIDILFDIEDVSDSMHQRRSGLNQVLCKMMSKYNVAYGINLSSIFNHQNRAQHLGRIMQNIMLCKKYGVEMVFGSFAKNPIEMRNSDDLESLLRILGVSSSKSCFSYISKSHSKKTGENGLQNGMRKL